MKWPLLFPAVSQARVPLYNRCYLHARGASQVDPTLVWGTEVDVAPLLSFLHERNRAGGVLVTIAHALIRATALALVQHPEMNARVVGRRVYAFGDVNVRMGFLNRRSGEADVLMIQRASEKGLEWIAHEVWHRLLQTRRGEASLDRDHARLRRLPSFWFRQLLNLYGFLDRNLPLPTLGRLDELRGGCVMVNDLSFPGAPPMRSYKPTRFPDESVSLNVTSGPIENKVVARSDQFVSTRIMPLFVRADHRLVDAYQVGHFLSAVCDLLHHPERLDAPGVPGGCSASSVQPTYAGLVPPDGSSAAA